MDSPCGYFRDGVGNLISWVHNVEIILFKNTIIVENTLFLGIALFVQNLWIAPVVISGKGLVIWNTENNNFWGQKLSILILHWLLSFLILVIIVSSCKEWEKPPLDSIVGPLLGTFSVDWGKWNQNGLKCAFFAMQTVKNVSS